MPRETLRLGIVDHHFDLHLRQEVDRVFGTAVGLRMALLATEPADFGDRHPLHTHRIEGVFHFLELEVANNGFNLFHG